MISEKDCQPYYEQKYASVSLVHPLLMAAEFLPRPQPDSRLNDWQHLMNLMAQYQWRFSADWRPAVLKSSTALVITDCDERIVWTNRTFAKMTGYSLAQVVGRNPNFLQGEATDQATKRQLRQHLQQRLAYSGTLLNYRRNGEAYWCWVHIEPLYNQSGELVHFIALENEVKPNL